MKQLDKHKQRENIIIDLLLKNESLRFSEIWNSVKDSLLFNSKRDLWDVLHRLINAKHPIVLRLEISHKLVVYALTGDVEQLERLRLWVNRVEKRFPTVKNDIRASKEDTNVDHVTKFYIAFMVKELSNYLRALSDWAEADEKWKRVAQIIAQNYNIRYFANLLLECMKSNPEAYGKAVSAVTETLDSLSGKVWKDFDDNLK
jgi:hypothetical protein